MKFSFDFDSTLTQKNVKAFAKHLIAISHDVIIVTTRKSDRDNGDLWKVCSEIDLNPNKVFFTNMRDKFETINKLKPFIHYDDDWIELNQINKFTNTVAISVWKTNSWLYKTKRIVANHDKGEFIKHMTELKNYFGDVKVCEDAIKKVFPNTYSAGLNDTIIISNYIKLLKERFNDAYDNIDYYIYELDWGRKATEKSITKDNKPIPINTIEDLWNLINNL